MAGLNKVILIGNVGKDPEVMSFDNARKASFPLATTEYYKNKNGEKVEQTEWHNIVCWRGLADVAEKFCQKGTQIYIEGKIRTRSWEDRSGNRRYSTEIVVDSLMLLSSRNNHNNQMDSNHAIEENPLSAILEENEMGDIPF